MVRSELRKYVRTCENKNEEELKQAGNKWLEVVARNKLVYEIDWLGIPIIQTPEDIVLMQEIIYDIKPDIIVEIGIAHGGGLIFYSSLLELIGKSHGKVIGVDIEIRQHNKEVIEKHPMFKRVTLIEGGSVEEKTVNKVKSLIPPNSKVILCLDSNHYKGHVLEELNKYWDIVNVGSYIIVFDTVTSFLAENNAADKSYLNNGPMEAIKEFLKKNDHFAIDKSYNKLYVSDCMDGFLKRIR